MAAFLPKALHNNFPTSYDENKHPTFLFSVLTSPPATLFYNGWWPVVIFFVLSGYVLTMPYFRDDEGGKATLERRLWGRYLRLNIPIIAATAIGYFAYRLGLMSNIAAGVKSHSGWLQGYLPQGISEISAATQAAYESIFYGFGTLIPPLWTLKVEFIGSLYVLLFYIVKPKNFVVLPMLAACVAIYILHRGESIFFYAIFAGSLLNYVKELRNFKVVIFVIGLYFGGYQYSSPIYHILPDIKWDGVEIWDTKTFYNTIGAILVTLAVVKGFAPSLFNSWVIQFLGRISFSLYLLHFIVLGTLASSAYLMLPKRLLFITFLIYIAASFAIAAVFERTVDRGAIKFSHWATSKLFGVRGQKKVAPPTVNKVAPASSNEVAFPAGDFGS